MNRVLRFLIVGPALLFSLSASAQGFVKTLVSCSTQNFSSGGFGGGSLENALVIEVQEVQYPKSHTMTVSQYQNQSTPPPNNGGGWGNGGNLGGGWGSGGGWGTPQDPWSQSPILKVLSHEIVQIKTNGPGNETVISGQSYELRLNFFRQMERYPAFLIARGKNTQLPLYCSFN